MQQNLMLVWLALRTKSAAIQDVFKHNMLVMQCWTLFFLCMICNRFKLMWPACVSSLCNHWSNCCLVICNSRILGASSLLLVFSYPLMKRLTFWVTILDICLTIIIVLTFGRKFYDNQLISLLNETFSASSLSRFDI